jgi:hypothetical protein
MRVESYYHTHLPKSMKMHLPDGSACVFARIFPRVSTNLEQEPDHSTATSLPSPGDQGSSDDARKSGAELAIENADPHRATNSFIEAGEEDLHFGVWLKARSSTGRRSGALGHCLGKSGDDPIHLRLGQSIEKR